jgi:hypothetical protein
VCSQRYFTSTLRLSTGFPYKVLSLSTNPQVPWCSQISSCFTWFSSSFRSAPHLWPVLMHTAAASAPLYGRLHGSFLTALEESDADELAQDLLASASHEQGELTEHASPFSSVLLLDMLLHSTIIRTQRSLLSLSHWRLLMALWLRCGISSRAPQA